MALQVAQVVTEVLSEEHSNLRISQATIEVLSKQRAKLVVPQMVIEVLYRQLPPAQAVGGGFYEHAIFIG